jgi:hypothetical protein
MMVISFLYVLILKPTNQFFATGIAILNSVLLFSIFDNMLVFSGLSFQLLYPLLFSISYKKGLKLETA